MIARIWQARTRPGMGEAYREYLERTGIKEYKEKGCKDVFVLTRDLDAGAVEYLLITIWDNMDAIRRFAGPDPQRAVYYPEDDRYFAEEERTPYVRHYEVSRT